MSDLAAPAAPAPEPAPSQGQEGASEAPAESRPASEAPEPRTSRRGGLPDNLDLGAKPAPESKEKPDVTSPDPDVTSPETPPGDTPEGEAIPSPDPEGVEPAPLEVPDDHVFEIETDPERGPEPWTLEELKQSAQLTEEAIRYKQLGEQAIEQRNRLVQDVMKSPLETLYNIANAVWNDPERARAWVAQAATEHLNQHIAYEEMPPEQRESMEKDRIIADLQARLQQQAAADAEAAEAREAQEEFQKTHNEISTAITALGYEADDETIQEVATVLDQSHLAGHTHITASIAAKMVIKELEERAEQQWENFDPAKAPPEVLEQFRAFEVERLKAGQKPTAAQPAERSSSSPSRRSRRAAGLGI